MKIRPLVIRVYSAVFTVLLTLTIVAAPISPAFALSDSNPDMTALTDRSVATPPIPDQALSNDEIDSLVGDLDPIKPSDELLEEKPAAASLGNIRLNTTCEGIVAATGKHYFGLWKKVIGNPEKAKCKEGANGTPGNWISRDVCNIDTMNDGTFFNGEILGAFKCKKY